jgi:hypothetical protein
VQPAHAPDGLVPGPQVEVIGVAQDDLRAQLFEHVLRNGLDRAGVPTGMKTGVSTVR